MTYSGGIPSGSKNANDPLATGSFSSDPGQDVFPANVFPPATSSSDYSLYSSNGPTIVSNIFAHYNIPKSVDQLPFGFGEGIKTIRNRPSGSTYGSFKNNKERKFQKNPATAPFNPLTVSPVLWWDADDASTITYDLGTSVTQWVDKSGNSVAAYQNTDSAQPVRTTRSWFSGGTAGGDVISTESGDSLFLPDLPETIDGDGQFTHFVVMSVKAYNNYKEWYKFGGGFTPTWRHYGMSYAGHIFKTTAGTNTQGFRTGFSNPKDVDTAYLIVFIGDAAAGYSTRLNGSEIDAPDGDTPLQMVNHGTSFFPPYTGGQIGDGGCDIAEMIHVPRLCTATEIADVEAYLNAKWGVY